MIHVIFELDGKEICAAPRDRLLDVLDDRTDHGLPLACRGGNCAACRVRVQTGAGALEPPLAAEREVLARCSADSNERLGCQICVTDQPAAQRVRLERV